MWPELPREPQAITRGEDHEPESHLIPLILDVALGRRASIRIYGDDYATPDGTCIRDYIHVSDLADAHLLAVKALETEAAAKNRLIFNLGNGQGFSVREVIESARRVTGHPIPAELHPRRPATRQCWSPALRRRFGNLAGSRAIRSSTTIVRTAWIWHQKRYKS